MKIFKNLFNRADALLKPLIPAIQELCVFDKQLPKDQQNPIFDQFYGTLIRGVDLLKKCENISPLNLFQHHRYASQILKLEEEINGFMASMPAHILPDARRLIADVQRTYPLDAADINRGTNDSIFKQALLVTNEPCQNSMMFQEMASLDLIDCDEMLNFHHDSAPGKSPFCVGLEKYIRDLKGLLLQREVSVVGVQSMAGGGKTTLALNLCDDPQIKGYFQNVVFITVSESPNLKGILEMMWEKIVGRKRPEFQNVEDARRQLGQQLQMQSRSTLVILDDVWSRANLEKLLFECPGLKTLITTRDSFTIPRNSSTALYQLPLLDPDDAVSLFCFWAFGQTSIPSNADANLVKEVMKDHQPMQTTSWSFANLTNIIQNGVQMFDSFISHICNEIVHKFDSMCQTEFLVQEVNIRKMYDALSKIHETNTKLGCLSNFFKEMFKDYHNGWGDVGSIIREFKSKLHKM